MIVDAHVHFIAPPLNAQYVEWLKTSKNKEFGPVYLWNNPAFQDMELQLKEMDQYGIHKSVITYSANVTQIIEVLSRTKEEKKEITAYLNDQMYEIQKKYGDRIIPCAWIDPNEEDSLTDEMEKVKQRGFQAVSVLCAYKGEKTTFLDHPKYECFWKLAEELGLPVFIHFSNLYHIDDKDAPLSGYMSDTLLYAGMGQLMEDSLCIARLVLGGLFDRHPGLKVVMGQLGGMLPFMLERFDMLYEMYLNGARKQGITATDREQPENFMRRLSEYRKNIYVDTHSMSGESIAAALKLLGEDHVLFGSDFPITPAEFGRGHGLCQLDRLEPKELKNKVLYENACRLLGV